MTSLAPFRRPLAALLAAATLAATIPAAHPPDAAARVSVPPDRIAVAERTNTARWVP